MHVQSLYQSIYPVPKHLLLAEISQGENKSRGCFCGSSTAGPPPWPTSCKGSPCPPSPSWWRAGWDVSYPKGDLHVGVGDQDKERQHSWNTSYNRLKPWRTGEYPLGYLTTPLQLVELSWNQHRLCTPFLQIPHLTACLLLSYHMQPA